MLRYFIGNKIITQIFLLFSLVLFLNDAYAWTGSGHRHVVSIAYSRLSSDIQQKVMDLLSSGDDLTKTGECKANTLDAAASWADCVRGNGPAQAAVMHADRTQLCPSVNVATKCKDKHCATDALKKAINDLSNNNNSIEVRRIALKLVLHLMGDLHQPLHASEAADPIHNGGTMTVLEEENGQPIILHAYWDFNVIKNIRNRKVHINNLIKAHAEEWAQGAVDDWVHQTVREASNAVYKEPLKEAMCDVSKMQVPILLTQEYKDAAANYADMKIAQAGVRLAVVLTKALATWDEPNKHTTRGN